MNFFKKFIFILSLSAVQRLGKIEAQNPGCGGTFHNPSGAISSPNYPYDYDNDLNCSYYIQMSPPNSVGIEFMSFATETCCDWLEVSCSSDSTIPAWRFSGSILPSPLSIPPCSSALLMFHTDISIVRPGFSLRYIVGGDSVTNRACGGTFASLSGTISSPNYPLNYGNDLDCYYRIQMSPSNSVGIEFISFDTERLYDWLEVSCPSVPSIPAQRFTGSALPSPLSIPLCYSVQLLFHTDRTVVRQGFSLRYMAGGVNVSNPGCGGTFYKPSGTISSPNYPSNYDNNLNCSYYIQVFPPTSLNIEFLSFDTETCCDWLEVDYSRSTGWRPQRFSGSVLPSPIHIPLCSSLLLLFHSDSTVVRQGFSLRYTVGGRRVSKPDCGGTFTNSSGTISSPNYPSNYSNDLTCSYYIQMSPPNSLGIKFISFDTQSCCDWLEVSCSADSTMLAKRFSGSALPAPLSIPLCSNVSLLFHTDGAVVRQGFSFRYMVGGGNVSNPGCGGTHSSLSGTISSPNYPSDYSNNLNCYYYIKISRPNSVNITFISFATEPTFDWLEVNCTENSAIPAQRFDGTDMPPFLSIHSCSRVQLLFHTDSSTVTRGFSLRYDIGNGLQRGLRMKPTNLYVRRDTNESIVLRCSSRANQPGVYPWWSFSTDGIMFRMITASDCSVRSSSFNRLLYSTAREDSTGACNLIISPSNVTSAIGFYTCTAATLDYAGALVAATIDPSFTITGSDIVRGDLISITCSVRVIQASWRFLQITPSVNIYSDDNKLRSIASSDTSSDTSASTVIVASPEVLPSFVCNINFTVLNSTFPSKYATNLPQNISLRTPSQQVLYWPENETMTIQGDDNGRMVANGVLTCFVPSNPPATYQWTHKKTNRLWRGPTVTVSNNGAYTCTANNTVRGVRHEASKSIRITIVG